MNVGSLFSGIGGLDHGLARAGFRHAFLCESDAWRRGVLGARFAGAYDLTEYRRWDSKVQRGGEDACWLWTGSLTTEGYGRFEIDGRDVTAHRYAYEHYVAEIPTGLQIDHLCRVRHCVNPAHMEAVTQRENILRGQGPTAENARKTHCIKGHAFTKENTYVPPSGQRVCRTCQRESNNRSYARRKSIPIYDDVRDVGINGAGVLDGDAPDAVSARGEGRGTVDLLTGGFPCQDVSVAGRRAGLAGARSGLFHEFARIADALRPDWLLVENVPGLLSSNGGRDFGVVLGTLADLGYGLAWRVLDSRFFGVPQRRRRVFIVGALADDDPRAAADRAGAVLAVGSRCPGHPAARGEAGADVAGTLGGGAGERGWAQDTERMTFVPTLGRALTKGERYDGDTETFIAAPLSHGSNPNSNIAGRRREDDFNLVTAFGEGYSAVREGASVRRLTPTECERLQALPDGWTNPDGDAPDSRRYAGLGDAVTASVGEWVGLRIMGAS